MSELLVLGGDSQIGAALAKSLRASGHSVRDTTRHADRVGEQRSFLDFANPGSLDDLRIEPEVVFICAAVTNMQRCEQDEVGSRVVNIKAVARAATRFGRRGAHLVFLSTNAVFDGTAAFPIATDNPAPLNEYGRQKLEAERAIAALGVRCTIIRFTKVLSFRTPLMVNWRAALSRGETIRPFGDLTIAPVSLVYAVHALEIASTVRPDGIVHVSGQTDVTYAEFAKQMARWMGVSASLVEHTSSQEAGVSLMRPPLRTALGMSVLEPQLGLTPQPINEVVESVLSPNAE